MTGRAYEHFHHYSRTNNILPERASLFAFETRNRIQKPHSHYPKISKRRRISQLKRHPQNNTRPRAPRTHTHSTAPTRPTIRHPDQAPFLLSMRGTVSISPLKEKARAFSHSQSIHGTTKTSSQPSQRPPTDRKDTQQNPIDKPPAPSHSAHSNEDRKTNNSTPPRTTNTGEARP